MNSHPFAIGSSDEIVRISKNRSSRQHDYAKLAHPIVTNDMLNGKVIRLDGAVRMAPR